MVSLHFLPWHRAIVMVVEDAIRALGGEYECFSMPYWYVMQYVIHVGVRSLSN